MKFLKNKYTKWYYQIINKARKRGQPDEYFERHHVIPKCMKGTNKWWNIVNLTYREHILVHWLLTRMTEGQIGIKMLWALSNMIGVDYVHNQPRVPPIWLLSLSKTAAKKAATGKNNYFFGKKHSEVTRAKMRAAKVGYKPKPISEETRLKMSLAASKRRLTTKEKARLSFVNKGKKLNDETKRKISESIKVWHEQVAKYSDRGKNISKTLKGRSHSEERKLNISKALKGKVAYGERNNKAKLTNEKVVQILFQVNEGIPIRKIADKYGISRNTIHWILIGKTWKHINRPATVIGV